MTRIPCGYKFVPTDDELLLYLSKKSDYVVCAIRNKHGTDDEPQQKRMKYKNSMEDKQSSFTQAAATPVSTLESDETIGFAGAAASDSVIQTTPISVLASEEALDFAAVSNYDDGYTAELISFDSKLDDMSFIDMISFDELVQ
ncbi:hypothetical protein PTKIN_Ptkin18bG0148500 [Pterospermum kingtungense]